MASIQRQPREYPKPAVGTGPGFDHPAQGSRPLLHPADALTKPDPVAGAFPADLVINPQREYLPVTGHPDARRGLTGVAQDVGQCFLNDSKSCQINAGW